MIEKRRRGSLGRSFLAVAAVVALMLALCAVAYAADWFGFRALLRPGTTEFEGQTYNNLSLTQPQAVPSWLDGSIAEKVENSKAAWAEFSAWREDDLSSFTERRHTAPDGTELTILSNGSDAYIYVYLEDSFFAMHVYGEGSLSEADVNFAADAINYSNIGR